MADTKISALGAATALTGAEEVPVVQGGANAKATVDQIRDVVKSVAAVSADGVILETSAVATVGAQKWSPRIRWTGSGWKTNATAAAQAVEFSAEVQPVQGAAAPTGKLVLSSAINGGAYTERFSVDSEGVVRISGAGTSFITSTASGALSVGDVTGGNNGTMNLATYFGTRYRDDNGQMALASFGTLSGLKLKNANGVTWSADATWYGTEDLAISRNAAGVGEVNNGTAGTFRDLKLRNLLAGGGNGSYVQTPSMTVANLAVAATAGNGARAYVTDATLAFNGTNIGSAAAGGGANHSPVVVVNGAWVIG